MKQIRVVFYNPLTGRIGYHLNELIRLKAHKSYSKYNYLIKYFMNDSKRRAAIFLELGEQNKLYVFLKIYLWMIINRIKFWRIQILTDISQLNSEKDIVFSLPFLTIHTCYFTKNCLLYRYPGLKLLNFSHYFNCTANLTSQIKKAKNYVVVAEADLTKNSFFKRHFSYVKEVKVIPFALRDRYKYLIPFEKRKAKCFACGTNSRVDMCPSYEDFIQFFKINVLHKLRDEIYHKKNTLTEFIDSYIYYFLELNEKKPKKFTEKLFHKIRTLIGNDRKDFFSFNIVEKYNEYMMFVSPEEESGHPSINFIEGMACGCVYFGRSIHYENLGMKDQVHYIAFDGSLEDLIEKIRYYQHNTTTLSKISENGRTFVQNNFKEKRVADLLWNFLEQKCLF